MVVFGMIEIVRSGIWLIRLVRTPIWGPFKAHIMIR